MTIFWVKNSSLERQLNWDGWSISAATKIIMSSVLDGEF